MDRIAIGFALAYSGEYRRRETPAAMTDTFISQRKLFYMLPYIFYCPVGTCNKKSIAFLNYFFKLCIIFCACKFCRLFCRLTVSAVISRNIGIVHGHVFAERKPDLARAYKSNSHMITTLSKAMLLPNPVRI